MGKRSQMRGMLRSKPRENNTDGHCKMNNPSYQHNASASRRICGFDCVNQCVNQNPFQNELNAIDKRYRIKNPNMVTWGKIGYE